MKTILAIVLWLLLIGLGVLYFLAPEAFYFTTSLIFAVSFILGVSWFGMWVLKAPVFNGREWNSKTGWCS